MTEQDWRTGTDLTPMLEFLHTAGKATDRKLRLFAVACCRRVWHWLGDECDRKAVEVSESFADELIGEADLSTAWEAVETGTFYTCGAAYFAKEAVKETVAAEIHAVRGRVADENHIEGCFYQIVFGLLRLERGVIAEAANSAAAAVASSVADVEGLPKQIAEDTRRAAIASERQQQTHLIRCIFGNPFRPVTFDPGWLTWQGGLLVSMAQRMYDSRDFSDMPVLADALEEAGCTNQEMLSHCRGRSDHVRGCWVADLLLGKE